MKTKLFTALLVTFLGVITLPSLANANADLGKICKAATASMFERDHKIIKLDNVTGGIAYVHYIRKNDNTRWAIKCKLDGDQIIWASNNPDSLKRWRTDPLDDVIKYNVEGKKIKITEQYSDGSHSEKTYPLSEL